MLKTLSIKSTEPRKDVIGVGCSKKKYYDRAKLVCKYEFDNVEVGNDKIGDNKVRKKDQNLSKSRKSSKSKKIIRLDFLISGVKIAFIKLR